MNHVSLFHQEFQVFCCFFFSKQAYSYSRNEWGQEKVETQNVKFYKRFSLSKKHNNKICV